MDHLWQSSLFGLFILLLLAVIGRRLTADGRRGLAWVGLIKFAVPASFLTQSLRRWDPAAAHWLTPLRLPLPVISTSWSRIGTSTPGWPSVLGATLALWLLGTLAILGVAVWGGWAVRRRLLLAAQPAADCLQVSLARAARRAGLKRVPECRAISAEESPGALGIVSPIVLLPLRLEQTLGAGELDAVLLHECVHIARRDNLWGALQTLLVSLNWFNPVAWLLSRTINVETEMACDERVLGASVPAPLYVQALAKTVRHSLGLMGAEFAPAGSSPVGTRLRNIEAFALRRPGDWAGRILVGCAALLALFSGYSGAVSAPEPLLRIGGDGNGHLVLIPSHPWGKPTVLTLVSRQGASSPGADGQRMPLALAQPLPFYPTALRREGTSGEAFVDFTVTEYGRVEEVTAGVYSHLEFAMAAIEAVKRWRYLSAEKNGQRVAAHLRVKVLFLAGPTEESGVAATLRPTTVALQFD